MKRALLVLAVLAVPGVAHADPPRRITFGVMGGGMFIEPPGQRGRPDVLGSMVSASVRWDRPPPARPVDRKRRFRGDLVPELSLLALGDRGAVTAGLRLELDGAERTSHGWWDPPRASMSLVPRVGVIEGGDTAVIGIDEIFEYCVGTGGWRVGWSVGMYQWKERTPQIRAFGAPAADPRRFAGTLAITVSR